MFFRQTSLIIFWNNHKWWEMIWYAKCKILTIGNTEEESVYFLQNNKLEHCQNEKDLGVNIDNKLNFDHHINYITSKANKVAGLIWRTFTYIDKEIFKKFYKSFVRPILEYAAPVWSPHLWRQVHLLERIQRRATKRIPGVGNLSYEECLKELKLPTLVYRRIRCDLIHTYKFVHGLFSSKSILPSFNNYPTRGNSLKLTKCHAKSNARCYIFSNRVVDWWNPLPEKILKAKSKESFKKELDNHFKDHPVVYRYTALDNPIKPSISIY